MIHRELCSVWKYYYYVNVFKNTFPPNFRPSNRYFRWFGELNGNQNFYAQRKLRSRFFEKDGNWTRISTGHRGIISMDRTFRVKPTENQRKSNRISERIRLLLKHNIRPTNSLAFASNKSHAHKHRIPSAERTRAALCIALYFRIRGSVERVNARTPPVASFLSSFAIRES